MKMIPIKDVDNKV